MPHPLRWLRHLFCSAAGTRALFSAQVLSRVQSAIVEAERAHAGEIRFAVETALPLSLLWRNIDARTRALQLFAQLHVWDTHANNGVLIYVLRADRALEIIADRGINARLTQAEWDAVCRDVEGYFRTGAYADGACAAVAAVGRLLAQHFPDGGSATNELPNQPILL